jgi:hypothetical protein
MQSFILKMTMDLSPERSRWMIPISEGGEKETGDGELPGRSRYLGYWNEEAKLRSKLLVM